MPWETHCVPDHALIHLVASLGAVLTAKAPSSVVDKAAVLCREHETSTKIPRSLQTQCERTVLWDVILGNRIARRLCSGIGSNLASIVFRKGGTQHQAHNEMLDVLEGQSRSTRDWFGFWHEPVGRSALLPVLVKPCKHTQARVRLNLSGPIRDQQSSAQTMRPDRCLHWVFSFLREALCRGLFRSPCHS